MEYRYEQASPSRASSSRTPQPDLVSGNMRKSSLHDARSASPRRSTTPQRVDFVVGNSTAVRVEPLGTYSKDYPPLQRSASVTSSRRGSRQSKRSSSLRTKACHPEPEEPAVLEVVAVDGCLVLGRQGPSFASYVTRYRVDREEQQKGVAREEAVEACFPCCINSTKQSPVKFMMTCLLSEAFLFTTSLVVLTVGVMRVLLMDRHDHEVLHSVVSSLEMMLTTANLLARFGLVRTMFTKLRTDITKLEHVEEGLSARGTDLRNWMWTYTALTALAILVNVTAYVILHLVFLHNWTLFINNLLLMSFATSSRIFTTHVTKLSNVIGQDHLRVTLYESTLLLREGFLATRSHQRKGYRDRVDSFLNAFRATKSFRKPGYVHVLRQYAPDWERHSMGTEPVTSC